MTPLSPGKTIWRTVPSKVHDARKKGQLAIGVMLDSGGHAYFVMKVPGTRGFKQLLVDGLWFSACVAEARK